LLIAITLALKGFSFALSGIIIPVAVLVGSSIRSRRTLSQKKLQIIEKP